MKKIKILSILLVMLVVAFCLVACISPTADTEGTMTLVVGEKQYTVDLSDVKVTDGVVSIIKYLNVTQDLTYEMQESEYGAYFTAVGDVKEDKNAGQYVYFFTTVEKDIDVSEYAMTTQYNGKTLTSSGVGASQMSIEKDCIIVIRAITF